MSRNYLQSDDFHRECARAAAQDDRAAERRALPDPIAAAIDGIRQHNSLLSRALVAEKQRDDLREALAGMVGLTQLLLGRDDLPDDARAALLLNHRVVTARETLARVGA